MDKYINQKIQKVRKYYTEILTQRDINEEILNKNQEIQK